MGGPRNLMKGEKFVRASLAASAISSSEEVEKGLQSLGNTWTSLGLAKGVGDQDQITSIWIKKEGN